MPRNDMTNREVAASAEFKALCAKHNVTPTKRQVSKFHRGKGLLVQRRKEAPSKD